MYIHDPLSFLLDLEQISFKYFAISFFTYSVIMNWYLKLNLKTKYLKEIGRWEIYNFTGKKIFTKLILAHKETFDNCIDNIW